MTPEQGQAIIDQGQAIIDLLTGLTQIGSVASGLLLAAIFIFGFDAMLPK